MNERIRKILIYYVKHSSEEDAALISVVVRNEKFGIIQLENYLCDEESTEEEGHCEHDVSGFGLVDVYREMRMEVFTLRLCISTQSMYFGTLRCTS